MRTQASTELGGSFVGAQRACCGVDNRLHTVQRHKEPKEREPSSTLSQVNRPEHKLVVKWRHDLPTIDKTTAKRPRDDSGVDQAAIQELRQGTHTLVPPESRSQASCDGKIPGQSYVASHLSV